MINLVNNILYHYKNFKVQYHFLKYLYNREFVLIASKLKDNKAVTIRNLKVSNIQGFQFILKRFNIFEKDRIYNMYYSLAKYKNGIPLQDLSKLSERDNVEWNNNHWNEMESYDFVLDIDTPTHNDIKFAVDSMESIKKFFDSCNCPYQLFFSGKGFHFRTEYKYFDSKYHFNPNEEGSVYQLYTKIALRLRDKFSELIDYSIYDSRRVIKLPFSLAIYENGVYVDKPINNYEYGSFGIDNYKNFNDIYNEKYYNKDGKVLNMINALKIK